MINTEDIIVACSSPPGSGAISCIRVSGKNCSKLFKKISGKKMVHKEAAICEIQLEHGLTEKCVLTSFISPNSYTGEDVIEISCHGNPLIVELIISKLNSLGCRNAEPGEFTMRSYLNEKVSLVEAETIADLISAETYEKLKTINKSLSGEFEKEISETISKLKKIRTKIEGEIDFNDQSIDINVMSLKSELKDFNVVFKDFITKIEAAVLLNEGVKVVITGPENAGKSTLMNVLAKENVSIVSEIPGTTRDLLSKSIKIQGFIFDFIDTAGLSDEQHGKIEKLGIERAKKALNQANIIIELIDPENMNYKAQYPKDPKVLKVINKLDLFESSDENKLCISAKYNKNINELKDSLISAAFKSKNKTLEGFSARTRHLELINKCYAETIAAEKLCFEDSVELSAEHLKSASNFLGQIMSPYSSDDLLGEIFSSFCVGK
ncbi:tRNA uridine-5-carboxymethylaminomethyl(34) synthesis GTPase MnmE [SAR86 cluster bacterium]|nr:tRNA uridine-5-carboxymethylaminomethyl(34) synthesis GTPase MnmE [SAR86 cluster bacterium]